MGIKEKGLKSSIWNWLSILVNQGRNFIVSLVLARLLSPDDFGLMGMALAFSGFVEVFVDFGFGNATIQAKNITQEQLSTVFYINLIVGSSLSLVMFFCSPLIANYFDMEQLTNICRVLSVSFIVLALSNLQNALYKKKLDFKTPFIINLTSGIITGIVGILMAFWGYGVWALVSSTLAGWTITTTLLWILSTWKPSKQFNLKSVSELWKFGYKNSLVVCIDSIFRKIDTLVIGKVFTASALGFFYRAQSLNQMVVQYSFSSIQPVLFPAFCEIKEDKVLMKNSVISLLHIVGFLTFFLSGLMYVCAEDLIVLLYTDKWLESAAIFKILGLFTFGYTLPTILCAPLLSLGKSGLLLRIEILKKVLLAISIAVGIYLGLYGYIFATQVACAIGVIVNMFFMREIGLSMINQLKILFIYIFPFISLIILSTFIFRYINLNLFFALLLKAVFFSAIYIVYSYLIKARGLKILFNNFLRPLVNKLKNDK